MQAEVKLVILESRLSRFKKKYFQCIIYFYLFLFMWIEKKKSGWIFTYIGWLFTYITCLYNTSVFKHHVKVNFT